VPSPAKFKRGQRRCALAAARVERQEYVMNFVLLWQRATDADTLGVGAESAQG
jgi:hypothetical protein